MGDVLLPEKNLPYMLRIIACFLSLVLVLSCEKEDAQPLPSASDDYFVVGTSGGWGGGRALKLEDGRLYVSGERAGVELNPESLVAGKWNPYGDTTDLRAIQDLRTDLPQGRFLPDNQRTICEASYADGACPFVVLYDREGGARGWTAEPGITAGPTEDYMDRVQRVVIDVLAE